MQKRIGINDDPLNHDQHQRSRIITDLNELGINQVRIPFHVEHLNPERGVYHWLEMDDAMRRYDEAHYEVFANVHGTPLYNTTAPAGDPNPQAYRPKEVNDLTDFIAVMCKRYSNITRVGVGNEVNTPPFWQPIPDPEDYKWILQAVRDKINSDPDLHHVKIGVQVAYQGIHVLGDNQTDGNFLEKLVANDGIALCDFVSMHPYVNQESEQDEVYADVAAKVEYLRKNGVREIIAGEFGISTYTGPKDYQPIITEQQQADYFKIAIPRLLALQFDHIYPFCISEFVNHRPRECGYGIVCKNGRRKPAYYAVKEEINHWIMGE